jgi:Domain of unknown function (DUF2341)
MSFPRKRESITRLILKWIPAFAGMTIVFCFVLGAIKPVFAETVIFQSPLVWRNDALGDYLFKDNGKLTGTRIASDGAVEFVSGPATYELLSAYQTSAAISSLTATWTFEGRVSLEVSATGNSADYTTVTNGVPLVLTKQSSGNNIKWRATLLDPGSRLTHVRISYADASGVSGSFGNPQLTGFNFQKTIWIKGGNRDHYLFQVPINVGQSVKSKKSDVTLKGVLQSDFDDIYFTLADGQTPLPFYRESITGPVGARTARFWVKMPQMPKDGFPIYMFYGRLYSSDLSNPESVFDFYYDFKDTVFNDAKWQAADLSTGIIEYEFNSSNTINRVDRKTLTTADQIIAFFKTGAGFAWVRQRKAAKTMPLPDAVKTASFAEEIPDLPGFQGITLAPNGDIVLARGQTQGTYTSSFIYPTQPVRIMIPEWKGEPPLLYKEGAGGVVPQVNVDISATADTAVYDQNCLNGTYYYASRKDFTPGNILGFRVRFSRQRADSLSPRLKQFSFDFRPGTISLVNPEVNENVQAGSNYNIVWSALDYEPSYKMDLAYSPDAGNTYQVIAKGAANSGNLLWQVPVALTQTAEIKVIDSLDNTIYGGSMGYFSVVSSNGAAQAATAPSQMTPAETSLNQEIAQQVANPQAPRPGTKLYEIAVKVGDSIPGNTLESTIAYKQGDIVAIAPAGWKWSKTERSSFVIVQAYLLDSEVSKFENPDVIVSKDRKGRQSAQQISPRRYRIDLAGRGLLNKNWQARQGSSSTLPTVSVDAIQDKAQ